MNISQQEIRHQDKSNFVWRFEINILANEKWYK